MSSRPFSRKPGSLSELLRPPRGFAPTKAGSVFFVFLAAIIVVSMLTGNNLLFLILAFLLSFMIVSGIESELNIRHLEVSRTPRPDIFAGRPGEICFGVRNPRQGSVRLTLHDGGTIRIAALRRGQREVFRQERTFARRGRHRLGNVKISTTYPYGLFRKSITFDLPDEVVVFPAPLPCLSSSSQGSSGQGEGVENESISHLRPYVPGDPLSSIAWKKQRSGLATRVVQGGGGGASVLVLDPSGDLERKLGEATFLILEWWRSGRSFGLSLNSYFSGLGSSAAHKAEILSQLALTDRLREPRMQDFPREWHVVRI